MQNATTMNNVNDNEKIRPYRGYMPLLFLNCFDQYYNFSSIFIAQLLQHGNDIFLKYLLCKKKLKCIPITNPFFEMTRYIEKKEKNIRIFQDSGNFDISI